MFRSVAAAVLFLLASIATGAEPADQYWRCRSAAGVTSIQDRPCPASEQTIFAPTRTVAAPPAQLAPRPLIRSPAAEAAPVSNAFKPLVSLAWQVAIVSIAVLVMTTAGRVLWGGNRRKQGIYRKRAGRKNKPESWVFSARDSGRPPGPPPQGGTSPVETPTRWSADLLNALEWKRVEEVCEGFWKAKGFLARATGPGSDGGVDVMISDNRDPSKVFAVAQCKAWSKPVGVEPVRALWGAKQHFGAELAIFYSIAGFSSDALAFAAGKHLKLVSGDELLSQLVALPLAESEPLLQQVTRGDYSTPSCPKCEVKMNRKRGLPGRSDYWACPNFRSCRTRPLRARAGR